MTSITWEFDPEERKAVQDIIEAHRDRPFVRRRISRNVKTPAPPVDKDRLWAAHLIAQLTSQQRSGPDSAVARFLREEAQQLNLERCRAAGDVETHVADLLKEFGGIRYYNNIGGACRINLRRLDDGDGWAELGQAIEPLQRARAREPRWKDWMRERQACRFVSEGVQEEGLHRVGPKQSRNFLQVLGLTRFEIPIDSRISKWINGNLAFPYHLSAEEGLSQPAFYDFHMDLVRGLCESVDEWPCVFDGAVFASYDDEWPDHAPGNTSVIDHILGAD